MQDDKPLPGASVPDPMANGVRAAFGDGMPESSLLRRLDLRSVYLPDADVHDEAPVKIDDASKDLRDPTGRYQVLGEIGRGGVGIVYKGRDLDLGRDVAMKVLRPEHVEHPEILARFVEEAQIGGQLQHPGIVPVYELGLQHGERPYFAMKLIKGETLAAQLAARSEPAHDRRRYLGIFEQICQTMAYAHARRVVHRDLKPANVMIGAFGEVQVVDWGFAKILPQGGIADEAAAQDRQAGPASVIRTVRTRPGSGTNSVQGSMLGTPAYMPPEQARGDVDHVDRRSDVFALGAILCEILTGKPPYANRDPLRQAVQADLAGCHALLAQSGADAPLLALCRQCLSPVPQDRPSSAQEVAAAISGYLSSIEERARQAQIRAAEAKVRARATLMLSAAAVLLLAAGGGGYLFVQHQAKTNSEKLAQSEAAGKQEAERAAELLRAKVREFDLLAGVVLYDRAIANEKELYPAWPSKVAAMERWLVEDAGRLLAMKGDIERTVREIESRALPPTAEEREADRRSHLRFAAFELLGRRVASLRYAQAIRDGSAQLAVPELTAEQRSIDAKALNSLAWARVAPPAKAGQPEERTIYGEEAFGLACARAALAKAYASDGEYEVLDTLAWAMLANGQDAEAKAKSAEALGSAPDDEHEAYLGYQRDLDAAATNAAEILALAEQELAGLTTAVNERRMFRFELEPQRFLHAMLAELLGKLGSLEAVEKAEVDKRLAWAKQIQGLSLAHPKARHTWAAVRASIAGNEKYSGLPIDLRDQDITGLVPIGENPVTKLWEFYDLRSAWDGKLDAQQIAIPAHRADGSIEVTGNTGIVFVLLRGGTFTMGAQKDDAEKPNFDPQAESDETPHQVTLAPFFLARHELTQGQWARLWTGDPSLRWPSYHKVGDSYEDSFDVIGPSHPVENVDWSMCDTLLRRHGMSLPTEAQWEFGCRAGTATPWYTGDLPTSLAGHANVLDRDALEQYPGWGIAEAFEDGFAGLAPVGHYRGSNAFGLYDVHGNVWEWCRDAYGSYSGPVHEGDALRLRGDGSSRRSGRGGSFVYPAAFARSAYRLYYAPAFRLNVVGLRCARTSGP